MRFKKQQALVGFQKGHIPHNKGLKTGLASPSPATRYTRLTEQQYIMAEGMLKKQSQRNPDILSEYRTTMLLRPRREESKLQKEARTATIQHPEKDTYRLWHPAKTEKMFNDAVKQQRAYKPKCSGDLLIDEDGEVKRGLVWKEILKCNKCTYVSSATNVHTFHILTNYIRRLNQSGVVRSKRQRI